MDVSVDKSLKILSVLIVFFIGIPLNSSMRNHRPGHIVPLQAQIQNDQTNRVKSTSDYIKTIFFKFYNE